MPAPFEPLPRAELQELLAGLDAGGFDGGQRLVVEEILRTALAYEEGAGRWAKHVAANVAANARYRERQRQLTAAPSPP